AEEADGHPGRTGPPYQWSGACAGSGLPVPHLHAAHLARRGEDPRPGAGAPHRAVLRRRRGRPLFGRHIHESERQPCTIRDDLSACSPGGGLMSNLAEYVMPEDEAQRRTNRITLIAGTVREGMEKLYS